MRFKEFEQKLNRMGFKIIKGPHKVWGIYKKMPQHPDAKPDGNVFCGGVSVPSGSLGNLLKKKIMIEYFPFVLKGYHETLKLLVDQHFADESRVKGLFGRNWRLH